MQHGHPLPQVSVTDVPADAPLLDVREDDEWAAGHVPWAQHLPMSGLGSRAGEIELPDEGPLYVVCHVGGRSAQVVMWLRSQGVDAVNVAGGMDAWERAGLPVE
ncbi:rhodanese-related sulfurtransferase [Motilibacter rhizosphaerae]|uniref:Rhodanese-related sulfurtransferase n=1 Tax=Motilibacter rhizosphaerae TaxID=598652 RepID=A0A4V2F519_9ACTN|nr:rhodanese-like domain-containing protein [Motilibacter rhizosphaerae]RZS91279.1 rhodanese-related sulfurtransferase [Motilibacter rhizosphaerae]